MLLPPIRARIGFGRNRISAGYDSSRHSAQIGPGHRPMGGGSDHHASRFSPDVASLSARNIGLPPHARLPRLLALLAVGLRLRWRDPRG